MNRTLTSHHSPHKMNHFTEMAYSLAEKQDLPYKMIFFSTLLAYLCTVSFLRFDRLKRLHSRFHYSSSRETFSKMTVNDAFAIHDELVHREFPLVFSTATMFALFKTYGIPSISGLLLATGQLCNGATSAKRNADTGALLLEAVLNPPSSERAITALARINHMHRYYRKMGKIRDSDMLYTLSLFALEPSKWIERYEWRKLSDLELCAIGTFWKSIGEALEVPFDELPSSSFSSSSSGKKVRSGLEWLNELSEWSRTYEEAHMVPAMSNKRLADSTFEIILWKMPRSLHGIGRNLLATLLDDNLRESML